MGKTTPAETPKQEVISPAIIIDEKIKGMRAMVETTVVNDDQTLAAITDKIKGVKTLGKFIRGVMEESTRPAREIIENAQRRYLPLEKECKAAEDLLKGKANEYMAKVEAERKRQEDIIARQEAAGRIKETTAERKLTELGDEKKNVVTEGAKLNRSMRKVAVIVDAEKIPHEYWVVDEVRVRKAALAGAVIPGVEVREEASISIR
jgi:hypothetical protein